MKNRKKKNIFIQLSSFCINNCDGCPYTKKERNQQFLINIKDFEKFINYITNYLKSINHYPYFHFGTGEVYQFDLSEYIKNIYKYEPSSIIAFATTAKKDLTKDILYYEQFIPKDKKKIFEIVFDALNTNENEIKIIKKNLELVQKFNYEIHFVLKTTINYKENINKIIKNVKSTETPVVTLDNVFIDPNRKNKLMTLKEYYEYFLYISNKIEKTGIKIASYINDFEELHPENTQFSSHSYYLKNTLELYPVVEGMYGDIILNEMNSNVNKILDLKEIKTKEEFVRKIKNYEQKLFNQNKKIININNVCKECEYKFVCSPYLINKISEHSNIELNKDICYFGKNIYKISEKKL